VKIISDLYIKGQHYNDKKKSKKKKFMTHMCSSKPKFNWNGPRDDALVQT